MQTLPSVQTNIPVVRQGRGKTGAYIVAGGTFAIGSFLLGSYAYLVDYYSQFGASRELYISAWWLVWSLFDVTAGILLYFGIKKFVKTYITFWTIIVGIGVCGHLILGGAYVALGVGLDPMIPVLYISGAIHLVIFVVYIAFLVVISKFKHDNINLFYVMPQIYIQPNAYPQSGYSTGTQLGQSGYSTGTHLGQSGYSTATTTTQFGANGKPLPGHA